MRARLTKKVSKIQPLKNPLAKPPIGELPDAPDKIPYSVMLQRA